jgi:hypothetical protein
MRSTFCYLKSISPSIKPPNRFAHKPPETNSRQRPKPGFGHNRRQQVSEIEDAVSGKIGAMVSCELDSAQGSRLLSPLSRKKAAGPLG